MIKWPTTFLSFFQVTGKVYLILTSGHHPVLPHNYHNSHSHNREQPKVRSTWLFLYIRSGCRAHYSTSWVAVGHTHQHACLSVVLERKRAKLVRRKWISAYPTPTWFLFLSVFFLLFLLLRLRYVLCMHICLVFCNWFLLTRRLRTINHSVKHWKRKKN